MRGFVGVRCTSGGALRPGCTSGVSGSEIIRRLWKEGPWYGPMFCRLVWIVFVWLAVSPTGEVRADTLALCSAGNVAGLAECVTRAEHVQSGISVTITGDIDCQGSESCDFRFQHVAGPLTITGASSAHRPMIRREPGYGGRLGITIDHSLGPVTISNLVIDDGPNRASGAPGAVWTNAACPVAAPCQGSPFTILYSSHVTVENVAALHGKPMGIELRADTEVSITHSTFIGNWLHGIWLAREPASRGLHIEQNVFKDNRASAIEFIAAPPGPGSGERWNTIRGNLFRHNTFASVYHVCGPAHDVPCGGGQLVIEQPSAAVLVEGNDISDGVADEDPVLTTRVPISGIEVAPSHVSDILIARNRIHDLTGSAIAVDSPDKTVGQLRAIGNCFHHVAQPALLGAQYLAENAGNGAECRQPAK